MARRYLAQLIMRGSDNLPENNCVTTFHFRPATDVGIVADEAAAIAGAIASAFGTPQGGNAQSVARWIGTDISRTLKPLVKVYKSESYDPDVDMGAPVFETAWAGMDSATGGAAMAREIAVCATYHADLTGVSENLALDPPGPAGDMHPKARRRGRIYWGPLTASANDNTTGRPVAAIIDELCDAMNYLLTAPALVAEDLQWCVYSRASETMFPVTGGWVDNEFDVQRRRGRDRTSRQLWGTGL